MRFDLWRYPSYSVQRLENTAVGGGGRAPDRVIGALEAVSLVHQCSDATHAGISQGICEMPYYYPRSHPTSRLRSFLSPSPSFSLSSSSNRLRSYLSIAFHKYSGPSSFHLGLLQLLQTDMAPSSHSFNLLTLHTIFLFSILIFQKQTNISIWPLCSMAKVTSSLPQI